MGEHTPTPWEYTYDEGLNYFLISTDRRQLHNERGHNLCDGSRTIAITTGRLYKNRKKRDENKADAAFIVRACNSHAVLVAALKDALSFIKTETSSKSSDTPYSFRAKAINSAKAALALAKGGNLI